LKAANIIINIFNELCFIFLSFNYKGVKMTDMQLNGFVVVEIKNLIPEIEKLRKYIFHVFNLISTRAGFQEVKDDFGLIKFRQQSQPLQFQALKILWGSPQLLAIASNQIFIDRLIGLGFEEPIMEIQPLLRCDMPIVGQSIFQQHQDYVYNIGSENSCTIWIPLQDVTQEDGALLVDPGSHNKGIFPNKKGIISEEYEFNFQSVPLKLGQALIFNQKLVHQSGLNTSKKIRFSIQLRFSDLGCKNYALRGYPINHRSVISKYEGEIT